MSSRSAHDPFGTVTGAIDQRLGDAYEDVRLVAERLQEILYLVANMEAVVTLAQSLSTVMITPKFQLNNTNGASWTTGAGVPTASEPKGSMYSRTDGAVGSTLYVSQGAGSWTPVAGV
jgi:hypothetical protein